MIAVRLGRRSDGSISHIINGTVPVSSRAATAD
jgi:hypothetical protein